MFDIIPNLDQKIEEVAALPASLISRKSDERNRTFDFTELVSVHKDVIELIKLLKGSQLGLLPTFKQERLLSIVEAVLESDREARTFDPDREDAERARNDIVTNQKARLQPLEEELMLFVVFLLSHPADLGILRARLDKLVEQMEDKNSKMDRILRDTQEQAAKVGVTQNAKVFREYAITHKNQAVIWLIATVVMSLASVGLALYFLLYGDSWNWATNTPHAIQLGIGKLIVLSALSFISIWCARNYKAHKHNQVVNQHRANALETFETFLAGTADQQVKDKILLHVAQAAFVGHKTGFDAAEKDSQNVNLVEVASKISDKTS